MTPARACAHCGRIVRVVQSRHLLAHACPHGEVCQPAYAERRRGIRGRQCAACKSTKQLVLPL